MIILVVCGQNNERLKINDRMRIAFRVSWEGCYYLIMQYAVKEVVVPGMPLVHNKQGPFGVLSNQLECYLSSSCSTAAPQ